MARFLAEQGEQGKQPSLRLLLSLLFSHELNSYLTYLTHSTQRKKRRGGRGNYREARLRSEQGSEQSEQGKPRSVSAGAAPHLLARGRGGAAIPLPGARSGFVIPSQCECRANVHTPKEGSGKEAPPISRK